MQKQSDKKTEASLDKNEYDQKKLVTIKIPLSLPYQNNWQDFERVSGEISFQGKIYKYVKRKVCNGELILLCLPDENKMRLQSAKDDLFKLANDIQKNTSSGKDDNNGGIQKNFSGVYECHNYESTLSVSFLNNSYCSCANIISPLSPSHATPEQPPDDFIS